MISQDISQEALIQEVHTSAESGLSEEEARKRLERYGENKLVQG